MSDIYYMTKSNHLVKMIDVVAAMRIMDVAVSDECAIEEIREFAMKCPGITEEIVNPSVEDLLAHGQFVPAIRLYRDQFHCSVSEARDAVSAMREKMTDVVL